MNTEGTMRRVVFLDIDGVLAPIRRWDSAAGGCWIPARDSTRTWGPRR